MCKIPCGTRRTIRCPRRHTTAIARASNNNRQASTGAEPRSTHPRKTGPKRTQSPLSPPSKHPSGGLAGAAGRAAFVAKMPHAKTGKGRQKPQGWPSPCPPFAAFLGFGVNSLLRLFASGRAGIPGSGAPPRSTTAATDRPQGGYPPAMPGLTPSRQVRQGGDKIRA